MVIHRECCNGVELGVLFDRVELLFCRSWTRERGPFNLSTKGVVFQSAQIVA